MSALDAIKEDLSALMEKHEINRLKVDVLVRAYPDPIISDCGKQLTDDWRAEDDFRILVADVVCQECEGEGGSFFNDYELADFAPAFVGQKMWLPCEECEDALNREFLTMPETVFPLWIARWAHKVEAGPQ